MGERMELSSIDLASIFFHGNSRHVASQGWEHGKGSITV